MADKDKKTFQDLIKKILQPSQIWQTRKLEHKEVIAFWGQLQENKINVLQYVQDLIKSISELEKYKKISSSKSVTLENLLCTLFAVSVFRELDQKNQVVQLKEKECSALLRPNSASLICPHTASMLETFFQIFGEKNETNYLQNFVGQMCFFPDLPISNLDTQDSQISSHLSNYFKQLEKYNSMLQDESPSHFSVLLLQENQLQETGEFSFAYEFFWNKMKQKKSIIHKIIFDAIGRYFKVLPQIAKEYPDQAEKSILSLLHLTKQIITFFGVRDNEYIKTVLTQVQIFRRWPYPVGNMAQELVSLLFQEYKSNGNAFRNKVREEIPSVDIFTEQEMPKHNQLNTNQSNQQSGQKSKDHTIINIPPTGLLGQQNSQINQSQEKLAYKAYIVADKDQTEINCLVLLSKQHENRIQSDHVLRAALVTNMLSLRKENNADIEVAQLISKKKKKDIFAIYCQLLHIIDKNSEFDDWDYIRKLQDTQFSKIILAIQEAKNDDSVSDEFIHSVLTENTQTYIPEFPNCELELIVPHIKQAYQKQATSRINHTQNQVQEENPLAQTYYPLLNENEIKQFQSNQIGDQQKFSQQFFDKYFDTSINPQYQQPHRFVVMGGDAELHGLVQVLGEYFDKYDNKRMNQLDLRVFIVPTKKNTLAHYLASKDVWYQRYLYLPFREELIIPKFEKSEDGVEKDPFQYLDQNQSDFKVMNTLLPQELKLMVLNTYIREASRAFNVRVYRINCRFLNKDTSVIYFCQYLEIGESVKAELIQRQKNLKRGESHLSLYEMKEKGQIKFGGVDLKITFQSVDYLGNKWDKETYEECFSSVKVNNVYKEYFEGNTPFPNSHWLEMTCITQENAKLFDNNLKNKHLFRVNQKDSQQGADQVQAAFKALFTSVPVESVDISIDPKDNRLESSFQILVDGKIFSGLTSISVEPVTLKTREPNNEVKNNPHIFLSLPVMTFLPLKL
ncbi:hypothetical protein TTHERM_00535670 (macronuclear) [Tetrahymena thermophila SB210]|uniref:Uncharacterized protein n=1 Tax=Tetrahymena thermophila (strain SB210) TaxID=312017 RepID=I7MLX2_TETTS|nr:hypothetical protein TTHERM_00535670 [Tetrahymena thermophila SB210]EAS03231.3 hypothetical protein TTHERM_00535670 [Tetrahymena thermophila SB210]|eukprot:XP_001023476.3 hypothetical protein TTHERM_00535670 [Tetrahymena thermophila SB210]